jgi:hypothetical protein
MGNLFAELSNDFDAIREARGESFYPISGNDLAKGE